MEITAIKQQVKNKDRYSIFVDGKYSFSLSQDGLLKSGVKLGLRLENAEYIKLQELSMLDKGMGRCLDLISRRPRSHWELVDYLKRKKYDKFDIDNILLRLAEKGYVDDEDFAKRWVDNRRLLKSTSQRKLHLELKQKRIDDEIVDKVLREDKTDELEVLRELIAKKRTQSRYKDEQKLIAYLARQGFNYGDIKEVLRNEVD